MSGGIHLRLINNDYSNVNKFGTSKKDFRVPLKENMHCLEQLISISLIYKLICSLNSLFEFLYSFNNELNEIFGTC